MQRITRRITSIGRDAVLGVLALAIAGCGAVSHTSQLERDSVRHADTRIEVGQTTNETGKTFDLDLPQMWSAALNKRLQDDNLNWSGPAQTEHLILTTKVVEYDEGDAFKRWLLPGWGSTVLSLHCELTDSASGQKVGSVDARRTVSFGGAYTIGAWATIFASVAKDVVNELRGQMQNVASAS